MYKKMDNSGTITSFKGYNKKVQTLIFIESDLFPGNFK